MKSISKSPNSQLSFEDLMGDAFFFNKAGIEDPLRKQGLLIEEEDEEEDEEEYANTKV